MCVFRGTQLDDERQVRLARRLGEVEPEEDLLAGAGCGLGNNNNSALFHADGSSNARRTRFTMLRAVESPPLGGAGGIIGELLCLLFLVHDLEGKKKGGRRKTKRKRKKEKGEVGVRVRC